ncbi:MAG: DUF1491 family protein [Rhodothalassiaceae bacterium]
MPSDARLPSQLFVAAHMRRCEALGLAVYLRHRGPREAGSILLKISDLRDGVRLLEMTTAITGSRAWMRIGGPAPLEDAKAEEMIARRLAHDPDLWVIEIEDPKGIHMLDEPVV